MRKGEEKWAFTATLPMNTPGLKIMSRRSYEAAANSGFDYPLSARFDENDALIFFENVKFMKKLIFLPHVKTMFILMFFKILKFSSTY